jgi:hypothetical protein
MTGSDIAFGNGIFVVGRSLLRNGFLTTTDGITWAKRDLFSGASVDSVAFGKGTFVAACSGGTYPAGIYQSRSVIDPIIQIDKQAGLQAMTLAISGQQERQYRLQTSSDLQTWTDYRGYTNTTPTVIFQEPLPLGSTQLFYRVVSP